MFCFPCLRVVVCLVFALFVLLLLCRLCFAFCCSLFNLTVCLFGHDVSFVVFSFPLFVLVVLSCASVMVALCLVCFVLLF